MSKDSAISWCHHSYNPWWGCFKVSDGCKNCYAETFSKRTGRDIWGPPATTERRLFGDAHWREPLKWDRAAQEAGERHRVFCASMADVFEDHPAVWNERNRLWDLIAETTNLDWLLLTKRPENVMRMVPMDWSHHWPEYVWLGTSVENQQAADERIPHLLASPAAVRFLSCEPLIGPLDLPFDNISNLPPLPGTEWLQPPTSSLGWYRINDFEPAISWVIVGGESGPKHRPMDVAWLRSIVEQCREAGVAVFTKQDSGLYPGRQGRIPDDYWVHQFPTVAEPGPAGARP